MKKLATMSLGAFAVLGLLAGPASAAHNIGQASKAAKYVMPLVRAYPECTAPNDTKPLPVGLLGDVCSTPGTHNALSSYSFGPKGFGTIELKWVKKNTKDYNANTVKDSPDDGDVVITLKLQDFRNPANQPYTGGAIGNGAAELRITDTYTGSGDSGTQEDITFPILAPPGQGCSNGKCTITTSADANFPGAVQTGKAANVQVGVGTDSNSVGPAWVRVNAPDGQQFATPGIILP